MEKFIIAAGCALRISDCSARVPEDGSKDAAHGTTVSVPQTILLLHGYLESLDVWENFVPLLTPAARVVSLDIPGHGISQVMGEVHTMDFLADVAVGVMDSLSIEKCVVVGHSMGGYVATALLKRHPKRVQSLVMLHSTPYADAQPKREQRQREIDIIISGKRDLLAATAPIHGFAEQNRRRLSSDIAALSERIQMFDEDGIIALLRGLASREDMSTLLAESAVSQLFIFGRKDEYITEQVAQKIIEEQPQAKVVWLEESGHMGFIEEPEKCAEVILNFAKQL